MNIDIDAALTDLLLPVRGAISYRPILSIPFYILANLFSLNMLGYFIVNIALHSLSSCLLYKKVSEITERRSIGLLFAFLFSISNFALYSIIQAEGLMEQLCILFLIVFISALYDVFHKDPDKTNRSACIALIALFLIVYTHERFIALTLPFYLVLLFSRKSFTRARTFFLFLALGCVPLISNILIKNAMSTPFLMGTGGTVMAFSPSMAIRHILYHVSYMFGLHPHGYAYLHGINPGDVHWIINIIIYVSILSIIAIFAIYIYIWIRHNKHLEKLKRSMVFVVISIVAIGSIIASSSFTIRVEMRWVMAPYLVALVLLAYVISVILKSCALLKEKNRNENSQTTKRIRGMATIVLVCVFTYSLSVFTYSLYYRSFFSNIFLINEWQRRANIIHEEILVQFRHAIPGASTIVIDRQALFLNGYYEYNYGLLYSVFGEDYKIIDFTAVYQIEDIDFTTIGKPLLLLQYDNQLGTFIPVVNELATQSRQVTEGFLGGGWVEQTAKVYLFNDSLSNTLRISGFWPEGFPDNKLTVSINSNETKIIEIIPGMEYEFTIGFDNSGGINTVVFETETFYDAGWANLGLMVTELVFSYASDPFIEYGQELWFTYGDQYGLNYIISGLSAPEPSGTWTLGHEAQMHVLLGETENDIVLLVNASPFIYGNAGLDKQTVILYVNDIYVTTEYFDEWGTYSFIIPNELLSFDDMNVLLFLLPDAISPAEIGVNEDIRQLAVFLHSIIIDEYLD